MKKFYILDTRQVVGNCASFWRPNSRGYTSELTEAGLYSEKEATSHRATDVAIPEELAKACAVTHVRLDRLREAMGGAGIKRPVAQAAGVDDDTEGTGAHVEDAG